MTTLEQLQQDIQTLSEAERQLLSDFIQLLKRSHTVRSTNSLYTENISEKSTYQKFQESGFIGCVSAEENLSTTYKQVLSEELSKKYDHR